MSHRLRCVVPALLIPVLAGLLILGSGSTGPAYGAGPHALPHAPCDMQVAPSYFYLSDTFSTLNNIAAAGPTAIAVVGWSQAGLSGPRRPIIAFGDGTRWVMQDVPDLGLADPSLMDLTGIAVINAADAWAVGSYSRTYGGWRYTLALHWDGWGWSVVPSPNPATGSNTLGQVVALTQDDVWAVGTMEDATTRQPLVEHWDGRVWSVAEIPLPDPFPVNGSLSLAAGGPADLWAVGSYQDSATGHTHSLTLHGDGRQWTAVPSPDPGTGGSRLYGVAVVAAADVWAVGGYYPTPAGGAVPLAIHWDGRAWAEVPVPTIPYPHDGADLIAVAASSGVVWAVNGIGQSLQWMGDEWHLAPYPAGYYLMPRGVAVAGPADVWVAAGTYVGSYTRATIVHYHDPCNGATATPTPPAFSDVPPGDTFYAAIRSVAAQGIMGGYPDGTFRPGNLTTRGQLSKILVLGYGLALQTPAAGASFEDVPRTDAFFAYVETVAARGIARGYRCGGVNPQTGAGLLCVAPQDRPYFLPGNTVTRGQVAKEIVVAGSQVAGWALLTPETGHFTDVPPGSTFYPYVETAAAHGVIGGYSDSTFRPDNNTTRAQSAAVLYRARAGNGAGLTSPDPTR